MSLLETVADVVNAQVPGFDRSMFQPDYTWRHRMGNCAARAVLGALVAEAMGVPETAMSLLVANRTTRDLGKAIHVFLVVDDAVHHIHGAVDSGEFAYAESLDAYTWEPGVEPSQQGEVSVIYTDVDGRTSPGPGFTVHTVADGLACYQQRRGTHDGIPMVTVGDYRHEYGGLLEVVRSFPSEIAR